jgi:hypothetical protein
LSVFAELQSWTSRRWTTAAIAAIIVTLVIGLPTDIVPNPVFGRAVGITWWSYPVLAVTALLGGLLAATYVRETRPELVADDKPPDAAALADCCHSSQSVARCATNWSSSPLAPWAPAVGSNPSSHT